MPAHDRVEDPGLAGPEDLRDQAEEAEVGRPVARGPLAVELGLGEHVEPELEILLVGRPFIAVA